MLSGGNVGIGTTSPSNKLQISSGDSVPLLLGPNATGWSDIRLKRNITPLTEEEGLDTIMKLQPVSFRWRDLKKDAKEGKQIDLIAQDVEKLYPEFVRTNEKHMFVETDKGKETIENPKNLNYQAMVAPLVKAMQELYAKFVGHDRSIASLEASDTAKDQRINKLERENAALKAYLCSKDSAAPICTE